MANDGISDIAQEGTRGTKMYELLSGIQAFGRDRFCGLPLFLGEERRTDPDTMPAQDKLHFATSLRLFGE